MDRDDIQPDTADQHAPKVSQRREVTGLEEIGFGLSMNFQQMLGTGFDHRDLGTALDLCENPFPHLLSGLAADPDDFGKDHDSATEGRPGLPPLLF